eukprot:5690307-Amphidinium_carterae.1
MLANGCVGRVPKRAAQCRVNACVSCLLERSDRIRMFKTRLASPVSCNTYRSRTAPLHLSLS